MTNEEAIDILSGEYKLCDRNCANDCTDCVKRAYELAIEALEKQITKKTKCYEDRFFHCPKCDEALGMKWKKYPTDKDPYTWLKFCWNCGQAIDAEEVEE